MTEYIIADLIRQTVTTKEYRNGETDGIYKLEVADKDASQVQTYFSVRSFMESQPGFDYRRRCAAYEREHDGKDVFEVIAMKEDVDAVFQRVSETPEKNEAREELEMMSPTAQENAKAIDIDMRKSERNRSFTDRLRDKYRDVREITHGLEKVNNKIKDQQAHML